MELVHNNVVTENRKGLFCRQNVKIQDATLFLRREHLESALSNYDFEYHRSTISLFGWDPGVLVNCYDAQALWFLGFPDRAEKAATNAVALAKKLASPFNEALCYALNATYYSYCRAPIKALEMSEAAIAIATDRGFLHWTALGNFNKGWSLCKLGHLTAGFPLLLDGIQKWQSMGAKMAIPTFEVLLGEIYQSQGDIRKSLAAVEDGLTIAEQNTDRHHDAELYRLKGELLLQRSTRPSSSNIREAESCFEQAIDIARQQKARSLEIRASIQLSRLWKRTGKNREAYLMLKKIYGKFTEGFDTPDLKEAKALLDELS